MPVDPVAGPPYRPVPLGAYLQEAAARDPGAPHLHVVREDGPKETVSYGASRDAALGIARALLAAGLSPGEPVAVLGGPSPLQVQATFGIWLAGGVLVPLDPQWEPVAHGRALKKAHVARGVALPGYVDALKEATREVPGFRVLDGAEAAAAGTSAGAASAAANGSSSVQAEAKQAPLPEVDPESRALILFTSGTTGEPKAAVLRHHALGWNAQAVAGGLAVTAHDNLLVVLPLHHVFGLLAGVLVPPLTGASATFPPSLKGPDVARTMRSSGVTLVPAVPQLILGFDRGIQAKLDAAPRLVRMLTSQLRKLVRVCRGFGFNPGRWLFKRVHQTVGPDLRVLGSAGAALDPHAAERLWSLGFNLVEAYGLTETGPAVSFDRIATPRFGSVGFPLPGVEVRINEPDDTGAGEIVVRSPSLFDGYLDAPEETEKVLRDGWLYTGDLGRLDAEGRLWVTGRSKEVIVLGSGKNVYPHEVEARLEDGRWIKECCVVGLPEDGKKGTEKLHAVVVPDLEAFRKAGEARIGVALYEEVIVLGDSLPSHHRVVGVTMRTEPLPRTALGKLKRFEIYRDLLESRAGKKKDTAPLVAPPPPASPYWPAVEAALRSVCGQEMPVAAASNIELDLGLDSLGRVEALTALEEQLGTRLPEGFGAEALTAGDLLARVDAWYEKGEQAQPASGFGDIARAEKVKLWTWQRIVARPFGWLIIFFGRPIALLLAKRYWQFAITGTENLPKGPCLVCPNHGSYVDAVALLLGFPPKIRFTFWSFGDYEIFGQPFMRLIAVLGNIIRINPGAGLKGTLEAGGAVLRSGATLALFPEGARAPEGERLVFRRGAAILARALNVPIVPAWLEGMDRLLPRGSSRVRYGHRIAIRFGAPIDPRSTDGATDPAQALTDVLRARVLELGEIESKLAQSSAASTETSR